MLLRLTFYLTLILSYTTNAGESRLVFNQNFVNSASGVSFKIPKGWRGQPLIAINLFNGKSKSNEIWHRQQHLAQFMGAESEDSILFAEVKSLRPNLNGKYTTIADFNKLVTNDAYKVSIRDPKKLNQWLTAYLQDHSEKSVKFSRKVITLPTARVKAHLFSNPNQVAIFFRAKDRKTYALIFTKTEDYSPKTWKRYTNNLIKSIKLSKPKSKSRTIVNSADGTGASRARVIQALKALPDWQYWETEHYIICSDLKSKDRKLISQLKANIEKYHFAYSQVIAPWEPITEVSVVKVFANRTDYLTYVGEDLKWSGGVWMPSKQELVVSPPGWNADKKQKADRVLKVLYHEAFHQYLHYASSGVRNSTWYNEGYAQLFEAATIKGSRIVVPENDWKASQLRSTLTSSKGSLKHVINLAHNQFYAEGQRTEAYSVSWALVYYLRKFAMPKKTVYKDILPRYGQELKKTKDHNKATKFAFKDIDMIQLQEDFIEFWQSSSKRKRAKRTRAFRNVKL
ncbi:MAG: DUF1570 domain-containing protein [Lentisphaeria bacterium]|nr:DUF1570 domain-containing protein [Lentisphaeria bacterium]